MSLQRTAKGLYALWYREFKIFTREYSRVISSIINPLFFMLIFGGGLGSVVDLPGIDYQTFIYPGFLAMAIIFTSISFGTYIVWDKKIDFLKEVLIAPISRTTIFVGKVLGGTTDAMIQIFILFLIGFLIGIPFTAASLLLSFAILLVLSIGLISMGLIIGSFMESPEGFGLVISFIAFPMFLLSGAFYPLDSLPAWMAVLTKINPVSYAVDGLRNVILGQSSMPLALSMPIMISFVVVMIIAGTWAFKRMRL